MNDTFLAHFAHDIRTLISAIFASTDLLSGSLRHEPEALALVQTIRQSSTHLQNLINNVLDLSKIEAGKMKLLLEPCDPGQIVSEVASLMQPRAAEKGLKLNVSCLSQIPQVIHTDAMRLRQILLNFMDNAIKFTHRGDVRLEVELVLDPPNPPVTAPSHGIRFRVVDTGIGISSQHQEEIFKPFVQARPSTGRNFGGIGLGLTISQQLAHLLGGEISVDSEVNRGTIFALSIPAGPLEGVPMVDRIPQLVLRPSKREAPPPRRYEGRLASVRVLLIEQQPDIRLLLSVILKSSGAVVSLTDGDQVAGQPDSLSVIDPADYDVVLVDMQTHHGDGGMVVQRIRQRGYSGPIFALISNLPQGQPNHWRQAGCNDYAVIPTDLDALITNIAQAVSDQG